MRLNAKLLHLLCTCSCLVLFWENVISWIETKLKLQLNLQPFNLLFEVEEDHDYHLIINCLLLHGRFLIYKCKIAKEIPDINMYFHSIRNVKTAEKEIAKQINVNLICTQRNGV